MLKFEHSNRIRRLSHIFFTLFVCLLALLAIALSGHCFRRTYIGNNATNKLSAKTLEMLSTLKFPLEGYVTMEDGDSDCIDLMTKDVGKLLGEYVDCVHGSSIKVEFVDLASIKSRNLAESALFLPTKAILLKYADRKKFIGSKNCMMCATAKLWDSAASVF
jgi:hypothetical protein